MTSYSSGASRAASFSQADHETIPEEWLKYMLEGSGVSVDFKAIRDELLVNSSASRSSSSVSVINNQNDPSSFWSSQNVSRPKLTENSVLASPELRPSYQNLDRLPSERKTLFGRSDSSLIPESERKKSVVKEKHLNSDFREISRKLESHGLTPLHQKLLKPEPEPTGLEQIQSLSNAINSLLLLIQERDQTIVELSKLPVQDMETSIRQSTSLTHKLEKERKSHEEQKMQNDEIQSHSETRRNVDNSDVQKLKSMGEHMKAVENERICKVSIISSFVNIVLIFFLKSW
ncbi:hypothetical protein HK096_008102 [Nowakowskiella sp. JEL0078]|nr:hypothetical protein HK096_008102 [Nowakowskiella sp. JEL0078]